MGIGALSLGGTIFETVRSWWNQQQAQRVIRDSLRPGARIGTYDPGAGEAPVIDTNNMPDYLAGANPWVASTINELGQTDARAGAYNAQLQENARARGAARPYMESIHERGTNGRMQELAADVQDYYTRTRDNPDIWSTGEMAAMASKYADQMAPALQGEMANIDATGARLGMAPAAVEAMRTIARTGASQNQAAHERDLFIANALQSADRADRMNTLLGQVGGTLQGSADAAANAADLLMAGWEGTPENYMLLGDLAYQSDMADTMLESNSYADVADSAAANANMFAGIYSGDQQRKAAAGAQPNMFESLLGPAAGAAGTLGVASAPALFGMKWAVLCIDADTLVPTTRGPVPLKRVQVGDLVLTPDGFQKVIARDVGRPHPLNNKWLAITTDGGTLRLTTTHHIGGRPAADLRVGDELETPRGPVSVLKIEPAEPPELAGDLELEGIESYCVGDVYVNSMFEHTAARKLARPMLLAA